jgi:hypothetical protein
MPDDFDNTKDRVLEMLGTIEPEIPTGMQIVVSINSYDGGPPKLSIIRRKPKKDGTLRHAQTGRLTEHEAVALTAIFAENNMANAFKAAKKKL